VLLLAGSPASASASLSFGPCSGEAPASFACATVSVPLERSGAVPGSVALKLARRQAGLTPSHSAVVALAGGPGQAALGLGEFLANAIGPALTNRDLLVFDQRGTGESDPLSCPAFTSQSASEAGTSVGEDGTSLGELVGSCAQQLGPARGAFTTRESVADIEAIRRATGYEKLVLYGTSYGTKVALEYAEEYPQNVEALVLDSVVLPTGPEPFALASFHAIPGVLNELCENDACAGITSNPVADLARLTAQLRKHALAGSVYDGTGQRRNVTLDEPGLFEILAAGDLNPALRALLPAAVVSALDHDPDPLLRLKALSEGLIPTVPGKPPQEGESSVDDTLYVDTSCEETLFPWQRTASAQTRQAEALTALRALPPSDFNPFDPATALDTSLVPTCVDWPATAPAPPPSRALPNVPTLILSGAQDLRTPTANARRLAAEIPDAQVLVVPFTGHSVLGADFSGCAEQAVQDFFSSVAVQQCTGTKDVFAPTPVTPTKLSSISPPAVLAGRPGQTLTATLDTILDLERQVAAATLQADAELPAGSSFGGLRGGYARLGSSAVVLDGFSFVPGVELSGSFPVRFGELQAGTLRVGGSRAAPGTIRLTLGRTASGRLGGKSFDVELAKVKLARASGAAGQWPTGKVAFPLPGLAGGR